MSTMSRTRLDGSGSQHKEDSFSFEGSQNMSQSSTSSSRSSQDAHQLHCSESMPSSTPSDESQPSQDAEHSLYKKPSPQLDSINCEITEMNGNKNGSHQNEVPELSISVEKDQATVATGQRSKSPRQKISASSSENGEIAGRMQTQTLAAHANLSRLAEIATCRPTAAPVLQTQEPNQPPRVLTTQQMNLVQSQLLATQTRYLTPGQNISLPVGLIQQNHFPYYGGYQPIPGGVFQHLGTVPLPPQGQYPPPFVKGSIIQLASGDLKRVEELTTEDFVQSTKLCPDLKLETSTVVLVNENNEGGIAMVTFSVDSSKQQVTLNCPVEHPFFVYGQGWSSCRPEQSQARYNLHCQPLKVGDVCIFLSPAAAALLSSSVTVINQGGPAIVDALSGPPNSTMPVTVSSGVTGATPSVGTASSDGQPRPEFPLCSTESVAHTVESTRSYQTQLSSPQGTHTNTTLNAQGIPVTGNVATQISHYQALPASFLGGAIHPQSLVHGAAIVPQSGVGNGLLMTAIGIVPSGGVLPLTQQGTIYSNQAVVETLPKQASNGMHTVVSQQDGKVLADSEDGQSESKRRKVEGDGK